MVTNLVFLYLSNSPIFTVLKFSRALLEVCYYHDMHRRRLETDPRPILRSLLGPSYLWRPHQRRVRRSYATPAREFNKNTTLHPHYFSGIVPSAGELLHTLSRIWLPDPDILPFMVFHNLWFWRINKTFDLMSVLFTKSCIPCSY